MANTDSDSVVPALRLKFIGHYNLEEDDFTGQHILQKLYVKAINLSLLGEKIRGNVAFYIKILGTGSRALSLERASLFKSNRNPPMGAIKSWFK